jgi:hypothetical protein
MAKIRRQPLQKIQNAMLNKIMIVNSEMPPLGGSVQIDKSSDIKLTATKYG